MNSSENNGQTLIRARDAELYGNLLIPEKALALVLFAHGSGSSRHSSRNQFVARILRSAGIATLLFDLLTEDEERVDIETREFRFDIPLLANRLTDATDWAQMQDECRELPIGLFGASTGAAAALITAAERPAAVGAVVSRGGRPDLAGEALPRVKAPSLMIVGSNDEPVIGMNKDALSQMSDDTETKLEIVEGATHLFVEPGTLDSAAALARDWFLRQLVRAPA